MRRIFFLLFPVCFPFLLRAQMPNMDHYTPARSGGKLPPDFLISTAEKYEMDRLKISTDDKKMREAEEQFYLQNNYSIDQMRFSGQVLVNDTMGMLVNRVADTLLANDPELRSKITFYVLRSSAVNAFTTDQGVIFITVGLLTRVHNEAELAFVIAHEIIHYKRHHVLTGYQEGVKAQQGIGQYEATTFENRFLKRHRYARSQESQADEEGFDLLVASHYDPHAAIAAFDILALADAPFSDTAFSKSFFETDLLVFPSKYQPDTVKAIKPQDEDEDDDLATHPSVYKRKKAIIRKFSKLDGKDTSGALFLVDPALFWKVHTMARFEEVEEHINDQEFPIAVYTGYADLKSYPSNYYLTRQMVRALYSEVIEKNRRYDFSDFSAMFQSLFINYGQGDDKPIGEQGRALAFINKCDATGWNVLALNYAWKAHLAYPDDRDITTWCYGIMRELATKNDVRMKDLMSNDSLMIAIGNKAMEDTAIAHKVKSNTAQVRYLAAIDKLDRDSLHDFNYWQFAFVNEMKDSSFVQMFRWACNYADSIDITDSLWREKSSSEQGRLQKERDRMFSAAQGLSSILAIKPIYAAYSDEYENSDMDVMASLKGKDNLLAEMQHSADLCGLKIKFLDEHFMDSNSVEMLNDLLVVSEWFDHRSEYGDNQILPFPADAMQRLADKYGTDYFLWSGYITSKYKRRGKVGLAIETLILPLAPHTLYRIFTKREDVNFIAIVYNVRTGKPVYVRNQQMTNQQATEARMKICVLDLMRILSSPKKEDKK